MPKETGTRPTCLISPQTRQRFDELFELRQVLANAHQTLVQARALWLCGLPYFRTSDRTVTRRARLGRGVYLSVTFASLDQDVELPFGSDRALLGWIQTRALRGASADGLITFSHLTEYLRAFGLGDSGRDYRDFYERLLRIQALAITVRLSNAEHEAREQMPLIRRSFLPRSPTAQPGDSSGSGAYEALPLPMRVSRYGLQLDPQFYSYLRGNPVPLPLELMRIYRGAPKLWDFASFTLYRAFASRQPSVLPWLELIEQLGTSDRSPRRLKKTLAAVLEEIRVIYPTFPVRFLPGQGGLVFEPWKPPPGR